MSDFMENENVTENEETESTIFSAPVQHKEKKTKNGGKKSLIKIISALLCVVILAGGLFAVIKFIPKKEDKDNTSSTFEEIEVLNVKSSDIKSITVKNSNGEFKIFGEKQENTSSDSSNSEDTSADTVNFYLQGVDKSLQNTSKAGELVAGISSVKATREITKKSAELCGLSGSKLTAQITKTDGKTTGIILGEDSPDNSGCYLKLSDSDKIYLVDGSIKSVLEFDEFYFAATDNMPAFAEFDGASDYFEEGSLTKFDGVTLSGKNFPDGLTIVPNDEKSFSEYIGYKITKPEEHYADNIDGIISLFATGVPVSGAYSYDSSETSARKFGLDNPDITVSMQILSKTLTYKFKLTENGDYAACCNEGKFIYRVEGSSIEAIANKKPADYYSSLICLYPIDKLNFLTVTNLDMVFKFDIRSNDDEETKDDIKYIIGLGDKNIDCQSFQNLYQYIVSLSCHDFTVDKVDFKPEISITFGFSSGGEVAVDFVKISDAKYQYYLNKKPMGKLPASKLSKFIKNVQKLANGETIGELS